MIFDITLIFTEPGITETTIFTPEIIGAQMSAYPPIRLVWIDQRLGDANAYDKVSQCEGNEAAAIADVRAFLRTRPPEAHRH